MQYFPRLSRPRRPRGDEGPGACYEGARIAHAEGGGWLEGLDRDDMVEPLRGIGARLPLAADERDGLAAFFCEARNFRRRFSEARLGIEAALTRDDEVAGGDALLEPERAGDDAEAGPEFRLAEGCQSVPEAAGG